MVDGGAGGGAARRREIQVPAGSRSLAAILSIPERARGIVLFAHGTGSGRYSPRNQAVARRLEAGGFATLLLDLLDPAEEYDRRNVFDVELLAGRLLTASEWVTKEADTRSLPVAYFGASTGAAAALIAAARRGERVRAVVSRGGRPDLAGPWLPSVVSPTLLIVGGEDHQVLELNDSACTELRCAKKLIVVPGATHLFEEPGALEKVADLAADWFGTHIRAPAPA